MGPQDQGCCGAARMRAGLRCTFLLNGVIIWEGRGKSRGAAIYILNESLMLFRNTADPRRRRALEPRAARP